MHVHSAAKKLGCKSVPQIVKAHTQRYRFRPQGPPARMYQWLTASICSLEAVRAEAAFVIGGALAVSAPAAAVLPALDDPGARERGTENLLRVRLTASLRAVWSREEQGPRSFVQLVLEPGPQRSGDGQHCCCSGLGSLSLVRATHGDRASR